MKVWGAWLAQSDQHATLDLGVLSLSPTSGAEVTEKIKRSLDKGKEK